GAARCLGPRATSGRPAGGRGAASGARAGPAGRLAELPEAAPEEVDEVPWLPAPRAIAYPPPARTTTAAAAAAMRSDSRDPARGRPAPRPGPLCPGPLCPGPLCPGPEWPGPGGPGPAPRPPRAGQ